MVPVFFMLNLERKNMTKNRIPLFQGLSDTATIESLKAYEKTILELQQTYKQTLDSMLEAAKNYQNKAKDNNPYAQALAIAQKEQEELNANVGYYKDAQEKRLNVDRWYIREYNKLLEMIKFLWNNTFSIQIMV